MISKEAMISKLKFLISHKIASVVYDQTVHQIISDFSRVKQMEYKTRYN